MANYILGQYNHKINAEEDWMTPVSSAGVEPVIVQTPLDLGLSSITEEMFIDGFEDPALHFNNNFILNTTYYCHCKIKRLDTSIQHFTIKLVNATKKENIYTIEDAEFEQYIKTINIQQGTGTEWVDVEFIFTPQAETFNTILLTLTRTVNDFIENSKRTPIVAFLEVSVINNTLKTITGDNFNLLKMGVQSRPGLKMCINREEISIGRTGIYEIKNGEIKVSFLSFINPATNKTNEDLKNVKSNKSYLNEVPEKRPFDGFAVDYIYNKEQE